MLPIKILRALKPRGVDVVVAHLRARPPWGMQPRARVNLKARRSTVFRPPAWLSGRGLKKIAQEHPFELVHAQHYGGATHASFACRRYGWPMVYEIHSLLGDEVERDRLGRGLVFRAVSSAGAQGLRARGRGDRSWASQSRKSSSTRRACRKIA